MNNSTSLVKSQMSQILPGGYNEYTYLGSKGDQFYRAEEETGIQISKLSEISRHTGKDYPKKYMFFVYVLLIIPPKEFFRCVGSLLSSKWVLTAAFCVTARNILIPNIRCVLSKGNLDKYFKKRLATPLNQEIEMKNVEERSILSYKLHPLFDNSSLIYDFVLMRLNGSFTYDIYLKPFTDSVEEPISGCWVIGISFEHSKVEQIDTVVKTISNVTVSTNYIKCKLPLTKLDSDSRFICAQYQIKNICKGEPGVPLICDGKVLGIATIVHDAASEYVQPQSIYNYQCLPSAEYYFNYLPDSLYWIKDVIPSRGDLSIYFNYNWIWIILSLMFIS